MRAVVHPADPHPDGAGEDWVPYAQAQPHLIAGLGEYCSYCERKIVTSMAVEHVIPKSLAPALEGQWSNYLLACVNCNSSKNDIYRVQVWYSGARWSETVPGTFCFFPHRIGATTNMYLPDDDNPQDRAAAMTAEQLRRAVSYGKDSFNVFQYLRSGQVVVNPSVPNNLTMDRVALTISMVRLDRVPNEKDQDLARAWKIDWQNLSPKTKGDNFKRSRSSAATVTIRTVDPSLGGDAGALLAHVSSLQSGPVQTAVAMGGTPNTVTRIQAKEDKSSDYRLIQRRETYEMALRYRSKFDRLLGLYSQKGNPMRTEQYALTPAEFQKRLSTLRKLTITQAKAVGYWSVWVTVFQTPTAANQDARFPTQPAIVPVLQDLLDPNHFPGTLPNASHDPLIYTTGLGPTDETQWNNLLALGQTASQTKFQTDILGPAVAPVQSTLDAANANLTKCTERVKELTKGLEESDQQVKDLTEKLATCNQRVKDLTSELEQCKQNNIKTQQALQQANQQSAKDRTELTDTQTRLDQTSQQLEQAQRQLEQTQQQLEQAQQQLADCRQQSTQTQQQLTQTQQQLTQVQGERDQVQQQLGVANWQLAQMQIQLHFAQTQAQVQANAGNANQGGGQDEPNKKRKLNDRDDDAF